MKPSRLLPMVGVAATSGALFAPAHAATGRQFGHPVHVGTDSLDMTGEPSIAVAPDGTEYIVAPDGAGVRAPAALGGAGVGGSLIWRSTNHGRTWQRLGSYDVPTGGGDSDIAVTPDGTLFASRLRYLPRSTISRRGDKGSTWVPMPVAGCGRTPISNDRQWNAVDGNGTVYTAIGDTVDTEIDLVRSAVNNPAVIPSATMTLSRTPDYQWPGTVDVDQRNGNVYTVWNTNGAPNDCDGDPGAESCKPSQASSKQADKVLVSVVGRSSTSPGKPIAVATRRFDTYDSFVVDAI